MISLTRGMLKKKKNSQKMIAKENRLVVGRRKIGGKWPGGTKAQSSTIREISTRGVMYNMVTTTNTAV